VRIGVNLIPLRLGLVGGAETYIMDLLNSLMRLDKENEYVLITAEYNHEALDLPFPNCKRRMIYAGSASMGALARWKDRVTRVLPVSALVEKRSREVKSAVLAEIISGEAIDLWFCPFGNLDMDAPPVASVITILDLQHVYYPRFFTREELRHRRRFYKSSCGAATRIMAISGFTGKTVVENYGVDPARVVVTWLAVGASFVPGLEAGRVREARRRYGLPDRYFFYPANFWPHKNHSRLLDALASLRNRGMAGLSLVLCGAGLDDRSAAGLKEKLAAAEGVKMLGYLPREDLPAVYAGADFMVYPSLFEGFGIPLIEAMAMGCPVAASNAASVPEVVGDAGLIFAPMDTEAMATAISRMHADEPLRRTLAARGIERARLFSRDETARKTLKAFEDAARAFRGGASRNA
jgi:glycosyltransferase involved in cell wall biosynthesis